MSWLKPIQIIGAAVGAISDGVWFNYRLSHFGCVLSSVRGIKAQGELVVIWPKNKLISLFQRGVLIVITRKQIHEIVLKTVDELNAERLPGQRIARDDNAVLFGRDGMLDSLGLVNAIVAIEQRFSDEFNIYITIADAKAMSQSHSPFKTVKSLIDYIDGLLRNHA